MLQMLFKVVQGEFLPLHETICSLMFFGYISNAKESLYKNSKYSILFELIKKYYVKKPAQTSSSNHRWSKLEICRKAISNKQLFTMLSISHNLDCLISPEFQPIKVLDIPFRAIAKSGIFQIASPLKLRSELPHKQHKPMMYYSRLETTDTIHPYSLFAMNFFTLPEIFWEQVCKDFTFPTAPIFRMFHHFTFSQTVYGGRAPPDSFELQLPLEALYW